MLESDTLRQQIAKQYNIDLESYKWNEEFTNEVFSIQLDPHLESYASTLGEIYKKGFNIGHCGLTSRYLARAFDKATLYYGNAKLLVGTKNSPNGEHAWITINNHLIDTTLMICIPISMASSLGYATEKEIAHDSARMLSEYDIFDLEYIEQQKNISLTHKKTN